MTLRDFTTAYQDLYIAYRKYLDRNPDEPFKEDLRLLVSSFDDARKFQDPPAARDLFIGIGQVLADKLTKRIAAEYEKQQISDGRSTVGLLIVC